MEGDTVNTRRETLLQAIRQAVAAGNQAGDAIPHPTRGSVGYQGAGADPVQRFSNELAAAGGIARIVADQDGAWARVLELVKKHQARRIVVGQGAVLDALGLTARLGSLGIEVFRADSNRESLFSADIGISGVDALLADTGTIVQASRSGQPRLLSLLPPVYIAVADRSQLLPDLFDWFQLFPADARMGDLPACISLITGPSKTGDIELRLVTGVHGPGEVHVVLINP
jgi:L-lactate dehydrogenase complex protein LldG